MWKELAKQPTLTCETNQRGRVGGAGSGPAAEVGPQGACVSSLGVWRDPHLYVLDLSGPRGGRKMRLWGL